MTGETLHPVSGDELQELRDGRLAEDRRRAVERHVEGCAECRRELAALEALAGAVAASRQAEPAPPELAARLGRLLDEEDERSPAAKRGAVRWNWAAAAAAVLAVAAVAALVFWVASVVTAPSLPRAVGADFRSLATGTLELELETADPAALDAFFRQHDSPATRVFDFAMMGYRLVGGSRHRLGRAPAALFAYRGATGELLCVMYRGKVPSGAAEIRRQEGIDFHVFPIHGGRVTLVFWQEGRIACVLAGRGNPEEIVALAVAKAQRV